LLLCIGGRVASAPATSDGRLTVTSSMVDAELTFVVGFTVTLSPASVGGPTVPSATAHGVHGCARAVGGVGKRVLARPTTPAAPGGSIE